MYYERLALLSARGSDLEQDIETNRDFIASRKPECSAELECYWGIMSISEMAHVLRTQRSSDIFITEALTEITSWSDEYDDLCIESSKIESHLEWFAQVRSEHDTSEYDTSEYASSEYAASE